MGKSSSVPRGEWFIWLLLIGVALTFCWLRWESPQVVQQAKAMPPALRPHVVHVDACFDVPELQETDIPSECPR